jgi:hypothetical protein
MHAMSTAREIESVLFKPVPEGYVYQAPNPWVFGRMRRYIVSEAQKAALLAIVTPPRPWLRIAVITAAIMLWTGAVAGAMWAITGDDQPTTIDFLIMMTLILGPIYLAWVAALRRNLRRMRPILAGAPTTQERITQREMRNAIADAMSLRKTLLIGGLWVFTFTTQVFSLIIRNPKHPLFSDLQSGLNVFTATIAVALAVYYLRAALRKFRQRAASAA